MRFGSIARTLEMVKYMANRASGGADIPACQMCRVFSADKNVCPTMVKKAG